MKQAACAWAGIGRTLFARVFLGEVLDLSERYRPTGHCNSGYRHVQFQVPLLRPRQSGRRQILQ